MATRGEKETAEHIRKFMEDTGMLAGQIAKEFRVSTSAVGHWLNKDEAPGWTLLGIEALRVRAAGDKPQDMVYIVRVPATAAQQVTKMLELFGCAVAGLPGFLTSGPNSD